MLRMLSSARPTFRPVQRFFSALQTPAAVTKESYGKDNADVSEHMDEYGRVYSTGKRKTSVARVWIKEGSGQFLINGKRVADYFTEVPRDHCMSPLVCAKTAGYFDVWCTVKGGGTSGQAGAVRLGVARALDLWDPTLRPLLRTERCLTRDSRIVERKKPGLKKARKQYQWVKR